MRIIKTEHHTIFESTDDRGTFQIRVLHNLSQIQIETEIDDEWGGNEEFADTNILEITMLRDMLTKAIDEVKKK